MIVLLAFVLPAALPGVANAQYREFTGKIQKISKKKLIVDNRMGDKVAFERVEATKIDDTSGGSERKTRWGDLKSRDRVTVRWMMMDQPRKAYEVIVLPAKAEAGDDL
jgi:hypothetical protein